MGKSATIEVQTKEDEWYRLTIQAGGFLTMAKEIDYLRESADWCAEQLPWDIKGDDITVDMIDQMDDAQRRMIASSQTRARCMASLSLVERRNGDGGDYETDRLPPVWATVDGFLYDLPTELAVAWVNTVNDLADVKASDPKVLAVIVNSSTES